MIATDESPITNPQIGSESAGMVNLGGSANGQIMAIGKNLFLLLTPSAPSQAPTVTDKDTVSSPRLKPANRSTTSMGWNTTTRQTNEPFQTPLKAVPTSDSPEQLLIKQQNSAIEAASADNALRKTQDTTANLLENIAFHMWQIRMQSA